MKTITHNGVPCVEAQVHMVATNMLTQNNNHPRPVIGKHFAGEIRYFKKGCPEFGFDADDSTDGMQEQHLYITTDEEIKEGDCRIHLGEGTICKPPHKLVHGENTFKGKVGWKKIIATTDPKLIADGVAEIEQSFIEKYCKAGGIDRVMVEVEEIIVQDAFKRRPDYNTYRPKTDSNNCITIHPVEENIYNVNKQVFLKLVHDVGDSLSQKDSIGFNLDKWIKENL